MGVYCALKSNWSNGNYIHWVLRFLENTVLFYYVFSFNLVKENFEINIIIVKGFPDYDSEISIFSVNTIPTKTSKYLKVFDTRFSHHTYFLSIESSMACGGSRDITIINAQSNI